MATSAVPSLLVSSLAVTSIVPPDPLNVYVYVTGSASTHLQVGVASLWQLSVHGAKEWSTKSLRIASIANDERVSTKTVEKHVVAMPKWVRFAAISKRSFGGMVPDG